MLQDAFVLLTDNVSLWNDNWKRFSDGEKSAFCPQTSPETVYVAPSTRPLAGKEREAGGTSRSVVDEDATAAAAVIPRSSVSVRPGAGKTGTTTSFSETKCDDNHDDDVDFDRGGGGGGASESKKWNCYTGFMKECFAAVPLTKV